MRNFVIFLSFLCICCTTLRANSAFQSTTFEHRGAKVRLIIPSELQAEAPSLLWRTKDSLAQAEKVMGLELLDSTEVYFNADPQYHNGLATVVPRDRILIHTEAPELYSSIGVYRDYLFETLTHEWAHILSLQQRRGAFRVFSWALGNSSRPNGLWPRWMHEGLAVYVESSLGGRPSSGWLDYFKRMYALEFQKTGRHPLNSSSLDGNATLPSQTTAPIQQAVGAGQIPYTFGYSVIAKLAEKNVGPGKWSEESSASLGFSFRKGIKALGADIDSVFQEVQSDWANTSVIEKSARVKELHRSESIAGPFPGSADYAWIEEKRLNPNEDSQLIITKVSKEGPSSAKHFRWKDLLWSPSQAVPLEDGYWFLLVEARKDRFASQFAHLRSPIRKRAFIYKEDGDSLAKECQFEISEKLIEAEVQIFPRGDNRKLAWVERRLDGKQEIFTAWIKNNCDLAGKKSYLLSAEAFERYSEIRWQLPPFDAVKVANPRQDLLSYTHTRSSMETNNTSLFDQNGNRWSVELKRDDAGPYVLSQLQRHPSLPLATAILQSRDYRGPILVNTSRLSSTKNSDADLLSLPAKKLPIQTGSHQAFFSPHSAELIYRENFWREDAVFSFPLSNPQSWDSVDLRVSVNRNEPALASAESVHNAKASPSAVGGADWENYSASETLWPKFWTPSLSANNNALIIVGQTFYSDVTERWSGSTLAGFNSQLGKPFASQFLNYTPKTSERWGQASLYLEYNPIDLRTFGITGITSQDRWTLNPAWQSSYTLSSNWVMLSSAGVQYVSSPPIGSLSGFNYWIPSLSLSFQSAGAFNFQSASSSLAMARPFSQYKIKYSWIEDSDLQVDIYRLFRTSRKSRLLASLEGAATTIDNFPLSFYTWGGLAPWTPLDSNSFLNRGFDSPYAAGKQIVRASLDWHQRLNTPELTLDWNRLRVSYIDLVSSAETLSWESYDGSSFKIGKDFASSVGLQLDIGGTALHYVRYKLGFGVFRGFGPKESFQFVTQLKTGLNI